MGAHLINSTSIWDNVTAECALVELISKLYFNYDIKRLPMLVFHLESAAPSEYLDFHQYFIQKMCPE